MNSSYCGFHCFPILDIKKIINDRVIRLIVEYNTDIFMRFIKDHKLYLDKYCNEVYIMNVDIWGVMSIYVDIIEKLSPLDKNNVKSEFKTTITKIMDKLVNIHIENLYKNGDKVINIPKLVSDIKELNEYLVSIDHGFNKNISVDSKISIKDVNKI